MGKGWLDRVGSAWDRTWEIGEATLKLLGAGDADVTTIGASRIRTLPKASAIQNDAALAAYTQEDHDGWLDSLLDASAFVGKRKLDETFGPEGIGGEVIGGLPEASVRRPVEAVLGPTGRVLEDVGREVIREPLATGLLKLANSGGGMETFDVSKWKQAYNMAQTTSVGQSLSVVLSGTDPFDKAQMEDFRHTDFYRVSSGATDAIVRLVADPDVLLGKAYKAKKAANAAIDTTPVVKDGARAADIAEEVATTTQRPFVADAVGNVDLADDKMVDELLARAKEAKIIEERLFDQPGLDKVMRSKRWAKVDEVIANMEGTVNQRAAQIQDRFFHGDPDGSVFASFLAEAPDAQAREKVMRVFYGDLKELDNLKDLQPILGRQLEKHMADSLLVDTRTSLWDRTMDIETSSLDPELAQYLDAAGGFVDDAAEGAAAAADDLAAAARDAMNATAEEIARNEQLIKMAGSITHAMEATKLGAARVTAKRSMYYQAGPGRAVQAFFHMVPDRLVDVTGAAPQSANHVRRWAEEAGFAVDEVDEWVGAYGRATRPIDRMQILEDMQDSALRQIGKERNLTPDAVTAVIDRAREGRRQTRNLLETRAYDSTGRAAITTRAEDGRIVKHHLPLSVTQTANLVLMGNIAETRKLFNRYTQMADEIPGALFLWDLKTDVLDMIMNEWKPLALLRVGWSAKFTLDEHARYAAKYGALAEGLAMARGSANMIAAQSRTLGLDQPVKLLNRGTTADELHGYQRLIRKYSSGVTRSKVAAGAAVGASLIVGGPVAAAGVGLGAGVLMGLARLEGKGIKQFSPNGIKVLGAWGTPGDQEKLIRAGVSAGQITKATFKRSEEGYLTRLRANPYKYTAIAPGGEGHLKQWAHALNNVIGQDVLLRKIALENMSPDDVVRWINAPENFEYMRRIGLDKYHASGSVEQWAEHAIDMVDTAVMRGSDESARLVTRATARTKITEAELSELVSDVSKRPFTNGPLIEEHIVSQNSAIRAYRDITEKAFKVLGQDVTDNLTRNPFFEDSYRAFMERALKGFKPGQLDQASITALEERGRRVALAELNKYMYDLSERSQFAEMARNLAPFYPASQEIMTRWIGLAVENPTFALRAAKVWNAPNKTDLVYTDPTTGEEYLSVRLPSFAGDAIDWIPWLQGATDSQGNVMMSKQGLVGLPNAFPSGPLAAMALGYFVEDNPEVELNAAYKFFVPFGTPDKNVLKALAPTTLRNAFKAAGKDLDPRERAVLHARILGKKMYEIHSGERVLDTNDPAQRAAFVREIEREASQMLHLKFITSFLSPTQIEFQTPMQPYLDYYRMLQEKQRADEELYKDDPDAWKKVTNADEVFLEEMGEEYFAVTTTMSKSINGIPATAAGAEFTERFAPLLESLETPNLAGLVFGTDGGSSTDEYLASVASKQKRTPVRPGSSTMQRETLGLDEMILQSDVRVGWMEYIKAVDAIDAARVQRGLPNLNVKEARDLADMKAGVTKALSEKYPQWRAALDERDAGDWTSKIRDLWKIAEHPDVSGRQSIEGLRDYLTYRESILSRMKAQGIGKLDSSKAMSLRAEWEGFVGVLTQDPAFSRTYHRWLENDPMGPETMRSEEGQ